MRITIPRRLTFPEFAELFTDEQRRALQNSDICEFDWRNTAWVSLPELAGLLCLSAKLIRLGKRVNWMLPNPRYPIENRENLRFWAGATKDTQHKLESIRTEAFSNDGMYSGARRKRLNALRESVSKSRRTPEFDNWLDAESQALESLDFLGFLERYDVFQRAADVGVTFSPDPRTLAKAKFASSDDSACLPFAPVRSQSDVDALVDQLCDPDELTRILGDYADLDFASSGALSQILVAELGKNVRDHASASAGWICTRLVNASSINRQSEDDPFLRPLRALRNGFVEVLVCDDGSGIGSGLDRVLERDQRKSVKEKYTKSAGRFKESDLIDYAFDRLSSTKRNIAELVHFSKDDKSSVLASGLYWIWNVVRTHHGIVGVRSGTFMGWYDFTKSDALPRDNANIPHIEGETVPFLFPGTMIRLVLPLVSGTPRTVAMPRAHTLQDRNRPSLQVHISWIGDLTRLTYSQKQNGASRTQPIRHSDSPQITLLEELKRRHARIADGDILLLNLAGTHRLWDSRNVAPLCKFFVEMNYTSTIGRSAVILWNVPHRDKALFDEAIADAASEYQRISDFRRAALIVCDDGHSQLLCGWLDAEHILGQLLTDGENDLDSLGAGSLNPETRDRLTTFVNDNAHLLSWVAPDRVCLRPAPIWLRDSAWSHEVEWLDRDIDHGITEGGALLRHNKGFFQLPSTGRLVKQFYSFAGMISHHASCSRIAWLLNQIIGGIETHAQKKVAVIVSVTRPVISLARHLEEHYLSSRGVRHLRATTVEELERKGKHLQPITAIFLADVVSSGALCEQVKDALPQLNWIGTAAILDTGDTSKDDTVYPTLLQDPHSTAIRYRVTRKAATGNVFALASRHIEKHDPKEELLENVTAIDRVTLCPIKGVELHNTVWPYLSRRPDALQAGHFHAGDIHHYVYYVNGAQLLRAKRMGSDETLCDEIVRQIVDELDAEGASPDQTVIMYPPRDTSYAEEIAIAAERATGAAYRYVLHREMFAGHQRFSSFIDHGIPIRDSIVVVIDDGSNTGETLIGLLQAAASASPRLVTAHIALSRMPPYKLDLLRRIRTLADVTASASTKFAVTLGIPVFNERTCPVCQFRQALSEFAERSVQLCRYAKELLDLSSSTATGSRGDVHPRVFCWAFRTATGAAQIREAIELADYHRPSLSLVVDTVKRVLATTDRCESVNDDLLNLSFVLAVEPDLLSLPIFIPFLERLFDQTCSSFALAESEQELLTLLQVSFHLMTQLHLRRICVPDECAEQFWQRALPLELLSIPTLGKALAACIVQVKHKTGFERQTKQDVCSAIAKQFTFSLKSTSRPEPDVNGAMGRLFMREMVAVLDGTLELFRPDISDTRPTLFALASSVAGRFWSHASEHVRRHVAQIANLNLSLDHVFGHIHSLVVLFDDLYHLQFRIVQIEQKFDDEFPGASVHWDSPLLVNAVASFGERLTSIAELVDQPANFDAATDHRVELELAWSALFEQLESAFTELFPAVDNVLDHMWVQQFESTSRLPESVLTPYDVRPLDLHDRCFLPRILLERFLRVAMQNLGDHAFRHWTLEEIAKDARVQLAITECEYKGDVQRIRIDIIDNGAMHNRDDSHDSHSNGHGKGLADVKRMAQEFGAELSKDTIGETGTRVSLTICMRPRLEALQ